MKHLNLNFLINLEQLTNIDSAIVQSNRNLSKTEFKIKRADSMTSVNSYFGGNSSESGSVEKSGKIPKKDQMFLRLCGDCGRILEKKFKSFKDNASNNKFTSKYDVSRVIYLTICCFIR